MSWFLLLTVIAIGLLSIAGIAALTRRGADERRDAAALPVIMIGATAYAALAAIGTLWSTIATLAASQVQVALPVRTFWPSPLPGVTDISGPTASVVSGGFSVAAVEVTGLDLTARAFLAGGIIVQGATLVVIGIVVALLCRRLLTDAPFAASLTRSLRLAAGTLALGGIVWQALTAIGSTLAANQVLRIDSWAFTGDVPAGGVADTGLPEPSLAFTIEFWPILIALALVAVAAAFRTGERMQRETAGLV
ncbi:hypothetical protein [Agrococcus sp. Ld7]|uniref:hypothetical protein n=1 Tax=Agrococcus sp. Ld7 TaxID=649148 RepID=UPI00386C050F